jgi:hypothetical protein
MINNFEYMYYSVRKRICWINLGFEQACIRCLANWLIVIQLTSLNPADYFTESERHTASAYILQQITPLFNTIIP